MSNKKHYDIFISYRRTDINGNDNCPTARSIKQELEKLGYKVFFDYSELKDNEFEAQILPAIANAKIFILVLTPHALDRCINEKDWVRQEIEHAQKNNKKIIPINIADKFKEIPEDVPEHIKGIKKIQYSTIYMGSSFERDVKAVDDDRIKPYLQGTSEAPISDTFLKIATDIPCKVFVDKKERAIAQVDDIIRIPLRGGRYMLKFVSITCDADFIEEKLFHIQPHTEELYPVALIPIRDARIAEERRIQEEERKRQEEWNQYRLSLPDEQIEKFKDNTWKYGFKDKSTDKEIIPCIYEDACPFSAGVARIKKNGKRGTINKIGSEIAPCIYEEIEPFYENLAKVKRESKYGFIDLSGNEIIPCTYEDAGSFSEGLAMVKKEEKWGFINQSADEIVPFVYDNVAPFSDGLAKVNKGGFFYGKYGFVNKTGKEITPCIYDNIWPFSEELAMVNKNGKYGFINQTGKEIIPCIYDNAWSFNDGLARVKKEGKYGFVDKTGEETIPCIYDKPGFFSSSMTFKDGLVCVKKDSKYGFVNKNGEEIIPCIYDNPNFFSAISFSEGLAYVGKDGRWFYIDKTGKEIIG